MRVAHITYRYRPALGGAEVYVEQLRRALAPLAPDPVFLQIAADPDDPGVVQVRPRRLTPWKLLDFNLGLLAHRRALETTDLVIVHNPEHWVSWSGTRTLLVSHGATWTHERSPLRRLLRRWAMRRAFRGADAVVANDSFVLRAMGYPVKPGTRFHAEVARGVWFVPNGVDTRRFHPRAAGDPDLAALRGELPVDRGPIVLVPRNLSRSRGIDLAIAAFARARALPPDAQLVITGGPIPDMPASFAYERELKQLARELAVAERVHFVGSLSHDRMPDVYRAASLTLVPTRSSEGTSLAALESMASATATLTTAVEGLLDLPGPHCSPDAEAMAAAIDALWSDRQRRGDEQRREVLEHFDLDIWCDSWRRIATQVVDGRQAAPAAAQAGGQ